MPAQGLALLFQSIAWRRTAYAILCASKLCPGFAVKSLPLHRPSRKFNATAILCVSIPSTGRASHSLASAEHRLALPIHCFASPCGAGALLRNSFAERGKAFRRIPLLYHGNAGPSVVPPSYPLPTQVDAVDRLCDAGPRFASAVRFVD